MFQFFQTPTGEPHSNRSSEQYGYQEPQSPQEPLSHLFSTTTIGWIETRLNVQLVPRLTDSDHLPPICVAAVGAASSSTTPLDRRSTSSHLYRKSTALHDNRPETTQNILSTGRKIYLPGRRFICARPLIYSDKEIRLINITHLDPPTKSHFRIRRQGDFNAHRLVRVSVRGCVLVQTAAGACESVRGLLVSATRTLIHIIMDCWFVAVGTGQLGATLDWKRRRLKIQSETTHGCTMKDSIVPSSTMVWGELRFLPSIGLNCTRHHSALNLTGTLETPTGTWIKTSLELPCSNPSANVSSGLKNSIWGTTTRYYR